jgi:hypothetical protein
VKRETQVSYLEVGKGRSDIRIISQSQGVIIGEANVIPVVVAEGLDNVLGGVGDESNGDKVGKNLLSRPGDNVNFRE